MTDYENKIKVLAERNRLATTEEERAAVAAEMNALRGKDEKAFTEALEELIKTTADEVQEQRMAERLGEITDMVSMAYIAKTYFKKSRSWLAHKLNGNIVNGKPSQFTEEELGIYKRARNSKKGSKAKKRVSILHRAPSLETATAINSFLSILLTHTCAHVYMHTIRA